MAWRAEPVCTQIIKQFSPASVIDVGCGIGEFLKFFKDKDIEIQGIEGTENIFPHLMIPKEDIDIMDITKFSVCPDQKFDLALCFMVIGRLPEETWLHCAEFLSQLSDTIITVVEKEWLWEKTMKAQGYSPDALATIEFRNALRPLFNKTAMRSFQFTQVFRRINHATA